MDGTRFPLKIGKTILSLESETHALSLKAKNLGVLGSQATIPGYRFFKKKWSYDTLFLKKQLHTMGNTPLIIVWTNNVSFIGLFSNHHHVRVFTS